MSDPKTNEQEQETFTPKEDIRYAQRFGGDLAIIAAEGVPIPMKEAKRLVAKGLLDLTTGKMPVKKAGK